MLTNVTNSLFGLSLHFFKIQTRSSHRMWITRLQILCIVFESQYGIIIFKNNEYLFCLRSPYYPFTNRSNFIRNEICCSLRQLFISYSPEGISLSSQSMNMRALVKVIILMTGIFLLLVLQNYHLLNAPNFRRL